MSLRSKTGDTSTLSRLNDTVLKTSYSSLQCLMFRTSSACFFIMGSATNLTYRVISVMGGLQDGLPNVFPGLHITCLGRYDTSLSFNAILSLRWVVYSRTSLYSISCLLNRLNMFHLYHWLNREQLLAQSTTVKYY
ncbi:uncharacterized protein LACBIDRAFT_331580 [Laccaria bicolor S238N-H82]|uniref:Predicted protein n=1 Tax=Laccaria bicolor (strain S238N-H82 / ATCC MYA-4686) TaxID=486041 RepID=B0DPW4_LACBS|nr:uncharacterized protein LACBIDRAFT_331580 [Laccaria bicolor S238N-H82]EDR03526.1 predicted protein [Laccaria bicolor S238N-H82]|eukprot:XP_001885982.1 predicted protein [Laccaria bicolor S238N-H82]